MSLACITGCVDPPEHAPACDADTCTGCLPRLAVDGTLVCCGCTWRATHALAQIPGLIAHIRDNIAPGSAPQRPDIKRTKGDAAPAPLNVTAVADADDLHADLASWVQRVIEYHGKLTGPTWHGSDIRPASKRYTAWGETVYEDARVVGTRGDYTDTRRLAQWLLTHLDWTLSQPWADEYVTTMPEAYWTVAGRWPTEERPKHLPTPCPACDRLTLKRYPPSFAGGPITITCTHNACHEVIPEDQYGLLTRVVLQRQKEPAA